MDGEILTNGETSTDSTKNADVSFTPAKIEVIEEPIVEIEAPLIQTDVEGGEEVPSQIEEFTIEDAKFICASILNVPGMFWGDHLLFQVGETDKFAEQFHRYCLKKGIDPWEYFFDELPLVIAGLGLAQIIRKRHIEHKEQEKKKEGREKSTKEKEEEEDITNIEECERKEG